MKPKFAYLLWMLLLSFGLVFSYATIYEIANDAIFPTKGLWRSLFASMIVVLLIDRIVRKTELEKSERSVTYVKGRIAHVCSKLARFLRPPPDWKERLKKDYFSWEDYFDRVNNSRMEASEDLEIILDRYGYLIEPGLRNDVFDIVRLLNQLMFQALLEPARSYSR